MQAGDAGALLVTIIDDSIDDDIDDDIDEGRPLRGKEHSLNGARAEADMRSVERIECMGHIVVLEPTVCNDEE